MFWLNSRLHTVEERISKLEYRTKEITESSPKTEEIWKIKRHGNRLWGPAIGLMRTPGERKKKKKEAL